MNEGFREKAQFLSEFWLKILAMVLMTLDHVGLFLLNYDRTSILGFSFRAAGRLAYPLFAFMIAEGMHKTHSRGRYLLRLAILWGLICLGQIILIYGFGASALALSDNPFADLILGALFIFLLELPGGKKGLAVLPAGYVIFSYVVALLDQNGLPSLPSAFPRWLLAGYSLFGFLLIIGFYYVKPVVDKISEKPTHDAGISMEAFQESRQYQSLLNAGSMLMLLVITVVGWAFSYLPGIDLDVVYMQSPGAPYVAQTWGLLAELLIFFYSGKRGWDGKPFRIVTYFYFPVHIAVIYLVFHLLSMV